MNLLAGIKDMSTREIALKKELVHRQRFRTRAQVKVAIFEYIEVFYNRQRRHSSIGYKTPLQAFKDTTLKMAA